MAVSRIRRSGAAALAVSAFVCCTTAAEDSLSSTSGTWEVVLDSLHPHRAQSHWVNPNRFLLLNRPHSLSRPTDCSSRTPEPAAFWRMIAAGRFAIVLANAGTGPGSFRHLP